jgi:hypothetical protein
LPRNAKALAGGKPTDLTGAPYANALGRDRGGFGRVGSPIRPPTAWCRSARPRLFILHDVLYAEQIPDCANALNRLTELIDSNGSERRDEK